MKEPRSERDPPGIGLYVHVPFCRRKCRYCDFYSRPPQEDPAELDRFVAAVAREAELRSKGVRLSGQADTFPPVGTVYLGGGTPSMLGAERLVTLLDAARDRLDVSSDAEITVEANPLDVTPGWAGAARAAGFNRISIGVQSVIEEDLRFLGRLHRAPDGPRAVETAQHAGFDEIGVDLIYGLPEQTPGMLRERISRALDACRPTHVSAYQLTYHAGTPLWDELRAGRCRRLSEDEEYALFVTLHEELAGRGYRAYEVSNFSLADEHRSRHNSNYWRHVPYIGLGPSAHSFDPPVRSWNVSDIGAYCSALEGGSLPTEGSETLSDDQLAAEMVMLALRTTDGLDLGRYGERFGRDFLEANEAAVQSAIDRGRLVVAGSHLRPTRDGLAVADRLAAELT